MEKCGEHEKITSMEISCPSSDDTKVYWLWLREGGRRGGGDFYRFFGNGELHDTSLSWRLPFCPVYFGTQVEEVSNVYVEYEEESSAFAALAVFRGRGFGWNVVECSCFNDDKCKNKDCAVWGLRIEINGVGKRTGVWCWKAFCTCAKCVEEMFWSRSTHVRIF